MGLLIRNLKGKSSAYLAAQFNSGFEDYYMEISLTAEVVEQMLLRESLVMDLSIEGVFFDQVIGFCWTGVREKAAWCGGIGLNPKYRGQGFGKELMTFCINRCRQEGLKTYQLECIKENERAIRLYQNLGLEVTGELYNFRNAHPQAIDDVSSESQFVSGSPLDVRRLWTELHQVEKSWQGDLTSIIFRLDLAEIRLLKKGKEVLGMMIYREMKKSIAVYDIAVRDENKELCQMMLAELHRMGKSIMIALIPEKSVLVSVLRDLGYTRYLDQVQMLLQL